MTASFLDEPPVSPAYWRADRGRPGRVVAARCGGATRHLGPLAQRMYSSSASYSVTSMFDATSVMPSDWNAGKSCSAAHLSI